LSFEVVSVFVDLFFLFGAQRVELAIVSRSSVGSRDNFLFRGKSNGSERLFVFREKEALKEMVFSVTREVKVVKGANSFELRVDERDDFGSTDTSVNRLCFQSKDVSVLETSECFHKLNFVHEDVLAEFSYFLEDDTFDVSGVRVTYVVAVIRTKEVDLDEFTEISLNLGPETDSFLLFEVLTFSVAEDNDFILIEKCSRSISSEQVNLSNSRVSSSRSSHLQTARTKK